MARYCRLWWIVLCFFMLGTTFAAASYQVTEISAVAESLQTSRHQVESATYGFEYGDEGAVPFTLPWAFTFYGQTYTQIVADINGAIWFSPSDPQNLPVSYPLSTTGPVISVWNNDLTAHTYGGVFVNYLSASNRVVVEWQVNSLVEADNVVQNRIQAVLFPDGTIRIHYLQMDEPGAADSGSGLSQGTGVDSLSLTGLYGAVTTLEGRAFSFSPVAGGSSLTVNPPPNPVTASSLTLSGTKAGDQTLTVLVDTTAQLGAISYPTSTTWELPVSDLAEGLNNLIVFATDAGGAVQSQAEPIHYDSGQVVYTLDTPVSQSNDGTATFTGTIESGGAVTAVDTTSSTQGTVTYPSATRWRVDFTALAEGTHALQITFTDDYTHSATETITLDVDNQPPDLTVNPVPFPIFVSEVTFSGTADNDATLSAETTAPATLSAFTSPAPGIWEVTVSNLQDGDNFVTVIATDAAGNRSSAVVWLYGFLDLDEDGIPDSQDTDKDGDRIPNDWEETHQFDPMDPADATLDSDGDKLSNRIEFNIKTDPWQTDSDSDGMDDNSEFWGIMHPLLSN